jgi:hypothetical protein
MPVFFRDQDGGFTGWLDVAVATDDAAGGLICEMRGSAVVDALATDFASAAELRGFLMAVGAAPAAIAAADEVWLRYERWKRQ